ncbi:biotin synthase BioB [Thiorhodospira sibirica]|uniref:biotin synthase BioB n=1 Tax=Thiorhodospira sibirica TaxID=154347 RepID=UPI00022C4631|nr:biotin synthase BioB [Thiorhodospira sibirica]
MTELRHDWRLEEILDYLERPFNDLLWTAHSIHRTHFNPNAMQISSLLSIKTGGCSEDCGYCSQSGHHEASVSKEQLLPLEQVVVAARQAKAQGAGRFCMGAAWRSLNEKHLQQVIEIVQAVKAQGLETCMTLGMLTQTQAQQLKAAGLDYYNHNLDTSPEFYGQVVTTHTYQDRLDTLNHVREAGLKMCSGGILGMGESRQDRAALLQQLANLPAHPHAVPINHLVKIAGTPLQEAPPLDPLEFVRTVATARIVMPRSYVRLSAGRAQMSDELQALCFFAGANSIFYGTNLLTTPNAEQHEDQALLARLGMDSAA